MMEQKEKLNKLMMRDDLEDEERTFLEECQLAFDSLDSLSFQEIEGLDTLYNKYFIDFEKAEKENKHLGDFGK